MEIFRSIEEFGLKNKNQSIVLAIGMFDGVHLGHQEVLEATCSADKARRLLNYKTKTKLDHGLKKMIDFIKEKGVKKFRYHLDLEILNSKTPKTWKEKLF